MTNAFANRCSGQTHREANDATTLASSVTGEIRRAVEILIVTVICLFQTCHVPYPPSVSTEQQTILMSAPRKHDTKSLNIETGQRV